MVAQAVKPKRKMPVSTGRGRAVAIPIPVRMRIRSLYLVQGLEPAQIAPQLGTNVKLTPLQISTLCHRQGWTVKKREVKAKIEQDALSRTQAELEETVIATAMLAEEGSISGIKNALDCAADPDAKDAAKNFAAWAAGSRQLVAIARQARGLDAKDSSGEGANQINVMFIGSGNLTRSAERITRNVTPVQAAQPTAQGESALPAVSPAQPVIDVAPAQQGNAS